MNIAVTEPPAGHGTLKREAITHDESSTGARLVPGPERRARRKVLGRAGLARRWLGQARQCSAVWWRGAGCRSLGAAIGQKQDGGGFATDICGRFWGRFYLGYTNIGILKIVATVFTCGIGALWPLVDGIMILMGNVPDAQGRRLRD